MGFLNNIFSNSSQTQTKSNPNSSFLSMFSGNSAAGESVNYNTAMKHSDVFTCVRIKAEGIGQLPVKLQKISGGTRKFVNEGRVFEIFAKRPNKFTTWGQFNAMATQYLETNGNFYAEIKYNNLGEVREIIPFRHQSNVSSNININGDIEYIYSTNDNKTGRVVNDSYDSNSILHIRTYLMGNDFTGMSTIQQNVLAIGTGIAGEKQTSETFENGARPSGILSTEKALSDDASKSLASSWKNSHGKGKSGGTAVLEDGMKYSQISLSSVDIQLLESREFTRTQIASMFRVPAHMLNVAGSSKAGTIQENNIEFYRNSLMPIAILIENAIGDLLHTGYTWKLDEIGFTRGDSQAQAAVAASNFERGLISHNEARAIINHDPLPEADGVNHDNLFVVQSNNLTFGTWSELSSLRTTQPTTNKE